MSAEPVARSKTNESVNNAHGRDSKKKSSKSGAAKENNVAAAPTMIDLFLSGIEVDGEELADEGGFSVLNKKKKKCLWIPDPQSEDEEEQRNMIARQKRAELRIKFGATTAKEAQVQDYWKVHAGWPEHWPEVEEHVTNQRLFADQFRMYALNVSRGAHAAARDLDTMQAFVVLSPNPVKIYLRPTMEVADEAGRTLHAGQTVLVVQMVHLRGSKLLKILQGGWVYVNSPEGEPVMQQIRQPQVGLWWYHVACRQYVECRTAPDASNCFRSGWVLTPGEVAVVALKCLVNGRPWVQLADGRGWIFTYKPDSNSEEVSEEDLVMGECGIDADTLAADAELGDADKVKKVSAAEKGHWQYEVLESPVLVIGMSVQGTFVKPGERLTVNMRISANGEKTKEVSSSSVQTIKNRTWLRLEDGRGWIPKTGTDNKPLVRFTGMGMRSQNTFFDPEADGAGIDGQQEPITSPDGWSMGVV